jgi:hypothetical protein
LLELRAGSNYADGMDVALLCLLNASNFDLETSTVRRPRPESGCCATKKKILLKTCSGCYSLDLVSVAGH